MISKLNLIFLVFLVSGITSIKVQTQVKAETNYVANGDFTTGYTGFTITQNYSGWKVIDGEIEIGKGTIYNNRWSSSTIVCEIDGNRNDTVGQTVVLPYDSDCILTFDYAARNNVSLVSNGLNVKWNNSAVFTMASSQDYEIKHASISVSGLKGNNQLNFIGAGNSDSLGVQFTNVSLTCQYVGCDN